MTFQLPVSQYGSAVGAKFFPNIASIWLMLCGIGLLFKKETMKEKSKGPFLTKEGWLRVLKLIILLSVFPLMFEYLGFIISSFVLLFVMITIFDLGKEEPLWKKVLAAVSVTSVLYVLFTFIIQIRLPMGSLMKMIFY